MRNLNTKIIFVEDAFDIKKQPKAYIEAQILFPLHCRENVFLRFGAKLYKEVDGKILEAIHIFLILRDQCKGHQP